MDEECASLQTLSSWLMGKILQILFEPGSSGLYLLLIWNGLYCVPTWLGKTLAPI